MRKLLFIITSFLVLMAFSSAQADTPFINYKNAKSITLLQVKRAIKKGANVNAVEEYDRHATVLMFASKKTKDSRIINALIKAGAKVNAKDRYGNTALMYACKDNRNPKIITALIKAGANVNAQSNERDNKGTALLFASRDNYSNSHSNIIKILLQAKADPNLRNYTTPLIRAVQSDNIENVKMLLKAGAKINAQDSSKGTPLYYASENIFLKMVKLLLKAGANPNTANSYGWTPLRMADQKPKIIRALLQAKANPNVVDKKGETLLYNAVYSGEAETVKLLLKAGADPNLGNDYHKAPLVQIEYVSNLAEEQAIVQALLKAGANPNVINADGETPLMVGRYLQGMQDLIKAGADVNAKDKEGQTPLIHIIDDEYRKPPMVTALIKAGADVNAKTNNGKTVLMFACATPSRSPKMIAELIKAGANVNAKTKDGMTSLMYALDHRVKITSAKMLIKARADINAKDSGDNNILIHTLDNNEHWRLTNSLLKAGADVKSANKDGDTPLLYAINHNMYPNTIDQLIKAGSDIHTKNNKGDTPLMAIMKNGKYLKSISLLIKAGLDVKDQSFTDELKYAIDNNNIKEVQYLMKVGVKPTLLSTAMNEYHPNITILKALLDAGADMNQTMLQRSSYLGPTIRNLFTKYTTVYKMTHKYKVTPLLSALQKHRGYAQIKRLIQQGAKVNSRILYYVDSKCSDSKIIKLFSKYPRNY